MDISGVQALKWTVLCLIQCRPRSSRSAAGEGRSLDFARGTSIAGCRRRCDKVRLLRRLNGLCMAAKSSASRLPSDNSPYSRSSTPSASRSARNGHPRSANSARHRNWFAATADRLPARAVSRRERPYACRIRSTTSITSIVCSLPHCAQSALCGWAWEDSSREVATSLRSFAANDDRGIVRWHVLPCRGHRTRTCLPIRRVAATARNAYCRNRRHSAACHIPRRGMS